MKRFREFSDLRKNAAGAQQPMIQSTDTTTPATATAPLPAVTDANQYRYRRFEGVNMGSWFVNEQWICQSVFQNAASPQQSDLDICKGSNAQANLQNHWDNWITTSDWQFIVNQGLNTIRLPIGYYHLSQASIIANTDFAPYGTVFSGAWQRILNVINTAASYGLGVLVDLHAAPGGQNKQPHSGTSSGVANLWGNATNLARTQQALNFLVQQLSPIANVVGLELLNEPQNGNYLSAWYVSTIQTLRQFSSDFPLYIHDAFDPQYYAKFVGSRTDLGYIVQDTHYYRCFSASDTAESSDNIIQDVINDTDGLWENIANWSEGRIIVGEWSAALAPSSLNQSSRTANSSRGYFAYVQLAMFRQDIAGGWMFWTIKKESGTDTGWSLQNARSANTVPGDFSDYFVIPEATTVDKQATMRTALNGFKQKLIDYPALHGRPGAPTPTTTTTDQSQEVADKAMPEAQSQLFQQGFEVGFEDAQTFSRGVTTTAPGAAWDPSRVRVGRIGHIGQWKKIRTLQFLKAQDELESRSLSLWQKLLRITRLKGNGSGGESEETRLKRVWEFVDGLDAGIRAVQEVGGGAVPTSGEIQNAFEKWAQEVKAEFESGSGKVESKGRR